MGLSDAAVSSGQLLAGGMHGMQTIYMAFTPCIVCTLQHGIDTDGV